MMKNLQKVIGQPAQKSLQDKRKASKGSIFNKDLAKAFLSKQSPLALEDILMEVHETAANSRPLGNPLGEEAISSNLAFDVEQGLVAAGTEKGEVLVVQMKNGGKAAKVRQVAMGPIQKVAMFVNQPFLVAVDCHSAIYIVDYDTGEVEQVPDGVDPDISEVVTCLYTPPFHFDRAESNDLFFVGTSASRVLVFGVGCEERLLSICSPVGDQVYEQVWGERDLYKVVSLKMHPCSQDKLLVCYQSARDCKSMVSVYSIQKNREVQILYFQPSVHQELGVAVAAEFSHDCSQIAVAFSSGKLDLFRVQMKIDFATPVQEERHNLNNNGVVKEADMAWRDLGDGRHCLFIFYKGAITLASSSSRDKKKKEVEEAEIGIFFGQVKQPLSKSFFINTLPNPDEQIRECHLCSFIFNNQNRNLEESLGEVLRQGQKGFIMAARKATWLKSNLLVAISKRNKLYYYNANQIGTPILFESDKQFRLFPTFPQSQSKKHFRLHQFIPVSLPHDHDLILHLEHLASISRQHSLFTSAQRDPIFQSLTNSKDISEKKLKFEEADAFKTQMLKSNIATNTELEQFLLKSSPYPLEKAAKMAEGEWKEHFHTETNEQKPNMRLIVGYLLGVSDQNTISLWRVETHKLVLLFKESDLISEQIVGIDMFKEENLMIFQGQSGSAWYLSLEGCLLKNQVREVEYQKLKLECFRGLKPEQNSIATVVKALKVESSTYLVQGFINGSIKVYSVTRQSVLANFSNIMDYSGINCLCCEGNRIYAGTNNGTVILMGVSESEVQILKQQNFDKHEIVALHSNDWKLYVLSERMLVTADSKSLAVKQKYEMPKQFRQEDEEEAFSIMCYSQYADSQTNPFSISVLLQQKKHLLMFDPDTQICYCAKDLSPLASSPLLSIASTSHKGIVFLLSNSGKCLLLTFKHSIRQPFPFERKHSGVFRERWGEQMQRAFQKGRLSYFTSANLCEQCKKNAAEKSVKERNLHRQKMEQLLKKTRGEPAKRKGKGVEEEEALLLQPTTAVVRSKTRTKTLEKILEEEEEKEPPSRNSEMVLRRQLASEIREKMMGIDKMTSLESRRRQTILMTRQSTGNKRRMSYFEP